MGGSHFKTIIPLATQPNVQQIQVPGSRFTYVRLVTSTTANPTTLQAGGPTTSTMQTGGAGGLGLCVWKGAGVLGPKRLWMEDGLYEVVEIAMVKDYGSLSIFMSSYMFLSTVALH